MERPVTSKSRGTCRYYNQPRGCFAGDKCKFTHGEPGDMVELTPYDQAKTCRFFSQGFCKRADKCWFKHTLPQAPTADEEDESEPCSICFEPAKLYGLLMGCSHVFCITCIKEWRDSSKKYSHEGISEVTKQCPMCRAPSKYITPSSIFYKHGDARKDSVVNAYKESMARVPCKYFQSKERNPFCPFGKDCFYQHINADGTPHVFRDGVDVCMKRRLSRENGSHSPGFHMRPFNYRNPFEFIDTIISDRLGDVAVHLSGVLEHIDDDFIQGRPLPARPPPTFFRHLFTSTQPRQPSDNDDDIDSDMPPLENIERSLSRSSVRTDDSMPRLQDVSESDSDEDVYWSNTDINDDEDDSGVDDMPSLERVTASAEPLSPPIADAVEPDNTGSSGARPPFTTDGRGRVIGASGEESATRHQEEAARSILGRLFDAFR